MNAVSATNLDDDQSTDTDTSTADCTVGTLPFPDDTVATYATAISSDGQYIAGNAIVEAFSGGLEERPVVWQDGELIEEYLGFPEGEPMLNSINSDGDAIATVRVPDGEEYSIFRAYSWIDGESESLAPDSPSHGGGVNDYGEMVGGVINPETDTYQPYIFNLSLPLGLPDGTSSARAVDVDNEGTIVGLAITPSGTAPYKWNDEGEATELTLHEGDFDLGSAISANGGWIIANATADDGSEGVAYWRPGETEGNAIKFSSVTSVNAQGKITGEFLGAAAYLWDEETNTLPSPNDDLELTDVAVDMSDDGTVVAGTVNQSDGVDEEDTRQAAVWNCG